jgi:hypothetical protein
MHNGWGKPWAYFPLTRKHGSAFNIDGFGPGMGRCYYGAEGKDGAFSAMIETVQRDITSERATNFRDANEIRAAEDDRRSKSLKTLESSLSECKSMLIIKINYKKVLTQLRGEVSSAANEYGALSDAIAYFDADIRRYEHSIAKLEKEIGEMVKVSV